MKSIQTKFIVLILGCILLSSSVIGGAGILNAKHVVDEDSVKIMNLMCKEKTGNQCAVSRIQQSVKTLAVYSIEQLESVECLKTDSEYINAYTQKLETVAVNAASNTEGIRQLCGMANNLNQLSHKANAGGFHDEQWNCKVAVARIHELLTKIGI